MFSGAKQIVRTKMLHSGHVAKSKNLGRQVVVKATNSKLLGTKILEIFDFFEYLT